MMRTEAELLARQASRESNARTYPRGLPFAPARALGCQVWSADGRKFLDFFAGAGVLALGHNHPVVVEAVRVQLEKLVHALDFPTPARDELVSEVLELMPESLRGKMKVHVCAPTGSDAVEAAVKLCKRATRRSDVVAFQGSYHGMTAGALALTSQRDVKEQVSSLMPNVAFSPYAYCARCPLKLARESCATACAAAFETLLEDGHSGVPLPAAAIMEFVQGEGGSIVPTREFVERVARAARAAKVPLIADEVQAGFGRTGRWWGFEHFDAAPDVIVASKGLSGIGLPLALIAYRAELDVWEPGTHIGTFRGHQLAFAAAAAAVQVMRREQLLENAAARGGQLLAGLRALKCPAIHDVRGVGLLLGIEFAHPGTGELLPEFARGVKRACFERGLLCELGGRKDAVLRLLPPLVVSEVDTAEALEIIAEAVSVTEQSFHF